MSTLRSRAKPEAASSDKAGNPAAASSSTPVIRPAAKQKPTKQETVTVACKLPQGMILQICKELEILSPEPGKPNNRVKEFRPVGDKIKVNGPGLAMGQQPDFRIVAGYALTEGVPKEFWETWLRQHKQDASVLNRLIFAHVSVASAVDEAKENRSRKTGLEGLNRSGKDPRIPAQKKNGALLEVTAGTREE